MLDRRAVLSLPEGYVLKENVCLKTDNFRKASRCRLTLLRLLRILIKLQIKIFNKSTLRYHAQDDLPLTKGTLLRHLTPWSEAFSWSWTPTIACIVFSSYLVRRPRGLDCTYVECFACLPPAYHRSKIQRVISTQDLCRLQLLHAASCHKFVIWTRVEANLHPQSNLGATEPCLQMEIHRFL